MRLALDLGTTTGWAAGEPTNWLSGTWNLAPSRHEGGGMRFLKFKGFLNELHAVTPISEIGYELVRNHSAVDAAHVYGGLLASLTEWGEENSVPYKGHAVGTIKKHWTGRGNANKAAMIHEAKRRGLMPKDDNEADAMAILDLMFHKSGDLKAFQKKIEAAMG